MNKNDLMLIQKKIGYQFVNPDLLHQAFVRRSYSRENGGNDNEVLELIGDKVLDIAVIRYLADKYGSVSKGAEPANFCCTLSEGKLTQLKAQMVEKTSLATRIDELDFAQYLIMGNGDIANNTAEQRSVKEDLFEAILGAVAIDCNWNFETLQQVAVKMLDPDSFTEDDDNYTQLIQNWCLKINNAMPDFTYYKHDCPEKAELSGKENENQRYMCSLKLKDDFPTFIENGKSKSDARKKACCKAYQWLENNHKLPSIKDEIEHPNKDDAINQLETLSRRGYFALPVYSFASETGDDGKLIWNCLCTIENQSGNGWAENKKDAKKEAAFQLLKTILK